MSYQDVWDYYNRREKYKRFREIMKRKKGCINCKHFSHRNLEICYKCLNGNNKFEKRY